MADKKQTVFTGYASNFINQSFLVASHSTAGDEGPLFFSFSEPGSSSSRAQLPLHRTEPDLIYDDEGDSELDDDRDDRGRPFLRGDQTYRQEADEDDPYLRLDDEVMSAHDEAHNESMPMVVSPSSPKIIRNILSESSTSSASSSPISPPLQLEPPLTNIGLTQSLLPPDNLSKSLFNLPPPGRVPKHKYNDLPWLVLWCFSLTACFLGLLLTLIFVRKPPSAPSPLPYSTLLHAIPFLTLTTFLSTVMSYVILLALQFAVKPVLMCIAFAIPFGLVMSSVWAFSGSFIWDGIDKGQSWGETVGLRVYSLVPFCLALLLARSLHNQRHAFIQTSRVTILSVSLLRIHYSLLVLSPALLLALLFVSLPFISLLFRLFLIGRYGGEPAAWHIQQWAGWLIAVVLVVWIWSWFVVRGVVRVVCSALIGAWYYKRKEYPDPYLTTEAALARAKGPSLGTIAVAGLIITLSEALIWILRLLRRLTTTPFTPLFLHPLSIPIAATQNVLSGLSTYGLIYTGLSGDAFWESVRKSRAVVNVKRGGVVKRHYTLLSTLLTMASLTTGSLLALSAYLFTSHTLRSPFHAPLSAFLAGAIGTLVVWFSTRVIVDVADTLYLCYCIDRSAGEQRVKEVFVIFEGRRSPGERNV